jgi:hypothetical protein
MSAQPFLFVGCVELQELLPVAARDERELLEHLQHVPDDCIFSHVSGFLLRRGALSEEYPNDFALWVGRELRDRRLAERLALVDLFGLGSIEAVRHELVTILEDHLRRMPSAPALPLGEPFHFIQSHFVPVPTGEGATTLAEFRDALAQVDASALFLHVIEARYRLARPRGDFAEWVEGSLGRPDLAARLARIDPHEVSLERLRDRHLTELARALEGGAA